METMYKVLYTSNLESDPALQGGSFLTDAPKTLDLKVIKFGNKVFEVVSVDPEEKVIIAKRIR